MKSKIYFDNAASTKIDKQVLTAMLPFLQENYGNASSLHQWGRITRTAIEESREKIAALINAKPSEIIFTGSPTEALNMAIIGASIVFKDSHKNTFTTAVEHHAGLDPFDYLTLHNMKKNVIPVDKQGLVDMLYIEKNIDENTAFVNVMYANNEVGTVQPVAEIAKMLKQKFKNSQKPVFHTDAAAAKYEDLDVNKLKIDMMTLAPHKFYGPKGIGILYIREGIKIMPIIRGGSHEKKLRPGTENIAYIVGSAKALELLSRDKQTARQKIKKLQQEIIKGILNNVPNARLTGHTEKRVPDIASFLIAGVEGEAMLLLLDDKGIAVSSGSACTSGSLMPSHVLRAMGYKPEECHGSLRISFGKYNTLDEVKYFLSVFPEIVKKLRKMAPKP